jgi:CDP-diacylglycerol---glycerol-3-phosphate 3-phosphatidyltransferase
VNGSFVSPELRARVRVLADPIARGFGRVGLTPNALTLIGFAISGAAAIACASGSWLAGAALVLFGGAFDLLDGALARATGTASRLGAFMDSTFDRAGEAVVYLGIVYACGAADFPLGALLAGAAMAAAFLVSYTRARAESLGFTPGRGMAAIGVAPREVRIVVLTVGLVAVHLQGGLHELVGSDGRTALGIDGRTALGITLFVIAALATVTVIQRIAHVMNQAAEREQQ